MSRAKISWSRSTRMYDTYRSSLIVVGSFNDMVFFFFLMMVMMMVW